ncbi:KilA-N domain-containing protein [Aliarcobacter cryaerophilus]|uniref:KilA-N domain-containing protein n=1 Tax=Aliarcobacter cryaerophilus TaxID=28198 RepID=UPI003DA3445B
MKNKIIVQEQIITIIEDDYISLTDMVRNIENGLVLIEKWLRNKNTIEFLGIWEEIYNTNFNSPEFEGIKNEAGLKRELAKIYKEFFLQNGVKFIEEPENSKSNYWLQAVLLENVKQRDDFLEFTNKNGVMTRPIWKLMNELEMYKDCQKTDLKNAKYLEERVVNIPSSVIK